MELKASGLQMILVPYQKADAEDWAKVTVTVTCSGFQGEFVAWLQSEDLRRFRSDLLTMYRVVGVPGSARLCSAEPGIDIELIMDARGHIVGLYRFESERVNGTPTMLSGELEMDQSFIPALTKQLDELILSLSS
ncbi:MAG TPA: hypothetical protein VMO00_08095 [Methylomirabilota bacterium]|nr:hypothetical protein [Methylomirabilota bacterium]